MADSWVPLIAIFPCAFAVMIARFIVSLEVLFCKGS